MCNFIKKYDTISTLFNYSLFSWKFVIYLSRSGFYRFNIVNSLYRSISVLFLFVIMMLNVRILEIYSTYSIYLPLAAFLSIIFFFWVLLIYWNNFSVIELDIIKPHINWIFYKNIKITAIGELLFNEGYILFIGATLLLFVAMIGAIILTLGKVEKKGYFDNHQNVVNWKYSSKG